MAFAPHPALVRRPVQFDHRLIGLGQRRPGAFAQQVSDLGVHRGDRTQDALPLVPGLVAVPALDRLPVILSTPRTAPRPGRSCRRRAGRSLRPWGARANQESPAPIGPRHQNASSSTPMVPEYQAACVGQRSSQGIFDATRRTGKGRRALIRACSGREPMVRSVRHASRARCSRRPAGWLSSARPPPGAAAAVPASVAAMIVSTCWATSAMFGRPQAASSRAPIAVRSRVPIAASSRMVPQTASLVGACRCEGAWARTAIQEERDG